jgi:enoyl-CoA hydratase/carnithine racemase
MEDHQVKIYEDNDFETYIDESIGIIKIKNNVFEIVTDIPESSKFIQAFDSFENNTAINAILIFNEGNCLGSDEYEKYLNTIFSIPEEEGKKTSIELSNRNIRTRQLVILNKLIRRLVDSPKLIVSALRGEIVTPFIGASLASDIRFASENVSFLLHHLKMNIHPSGALPYFLQRHIGYAKTSKILYGKDQLSLQEVSELGLIHEIFPVQNFEEYCIKKIKEIVLKGDNAIKYTKKLLNYNLDDLIGYLNMEETECKF